MKKRKYNSKVSIRLSCILLNITPTYHMFKKVQEKQKRLPDNNYMLKKVHWKPKRPADNKKMLKKVHGKSNRPPDNKYTGGNWHKQCLVPPSSLLLQRLLNKDNKLSSASCNNHGVIFHRNRKI